MRQWLELRLGVTANSGGDDSRWVNQSQLMNLERSLAPMIVTPKCLGNTTCPALSLTYETAE
jgi:hypothetical protein